MEQGTPKRVTLRIRGMGCAGCVAGVEQALTRAAGVRDARVSLSEGRAVVEYDPAITDPAALADRVATTGYEAAVLQAGEAVSGRIQ